MAGLTGMGGYVGATRKTESGVDIAYVLEYGAITYYRTTEGSMIVEELGIPARPLWRPTFQECEPGVKKIYKEAMEQTLKGEDYA